MFWNDILSLNTEISRVTQVDSPNTAIAKEFLKYLEIEGSRYTLKEFRFGRLNRELVEFCVINDHIRGTSPIVIQNSDNTAKFTAEVFKRSCYVSTAKPLYVAEALERYEQFLLIDAVESMSPEASTILLNDFVFKVLDRLSIPAVLQASPLYYGDYVMSKGYSGLDSALDKLERYYQTFGFASLNETYGEYSESRIMYRDPDVVHITVE